MNGKFVTRIQYMNWMTPENMRNTRNASISLSREEVLSLYALNSVWMALLVSVTCCCACLVVVDATAAGGLAGDLAGMSGL